MDSTITSLPPDPRPVAACRPRAALPGEDEPLSHDTKVYASMAAGPADHFARSPAVPATPKHQRRGRALLLATAAVLVIAAAGGTFMLSPYNTAYPVDTVRLEAQARQLATSAGIPLPLLVAPAARLASAPRPETQPAYRDPVRDATPDEQTNEIRRFRNEPAGLSLGAETMASERLSGQARPANALVAATTTQKPSAEGQEVGSDPVAVVPPPHRAPVAQPANPALPPKSIPPAPVQDASPDLEANFAVPATPAVTPAAGNAAAAPLAVLAALPAALIQTPPVSPGPDAVAVAAALQPAPMARGEQIDVLHTVAQLGIMMRDQRTENAILRARLQAVVEKVDAALADYERRIALAEARGAINAAMGADADTASTAALTTASASPPRSARPTTAAQPISFQVQVPSATPPSAADPRRYKVQAASPGLAMLSALDRSGGEGSQLQVAIGDQVPGYGKITAIQQRGTSWTVQTDRGVIQ